MKDETKDKIKDVVFATSIILFAAIGLSLGAWGVYKIKIAQSLIQAQIDICIVTEYEKYENVDRWDMLKYCKAKSRVENN